jgi:uncharacterized damage-inducible protein DinB
MRCVHSLAENTNCLGFQQDTPWTTHLQSEGTPDVRRDFVSEPERIVDQLRRAMDGQAWHGPALRELLQGVSPDMAAAKPIPGAHSIWEILLHITAWTEVVRRRLQGDRAQLSSEENWPTIEETSEAAWNTALDRLEQAHQHLLHDLEQLSPTRLDEPIGQGRSSVYVTLHGLVQHHLYHAGQIALLKRAASPR